jgi:hypothetical protein
MAHVNVDAAQRASVWTSTGGTPCSVHIWFLCFSAYVKDT